MKFSCLKACRLPSSGVQLEVRCLVLKIHPFMLLSCLCNYTRNERGHLHASTLRKGGRRQQRAEQLLTKAFRFAARSCFSSESLSNSSSSFRFKLTQCPNADFLGATDWRVTFAKQLLSKNFWTAPEPNSLGHDDMMMRQISWAEERVSGFSQLL